MGRDSPVSGGLMMFSWNFLFSLSTPMGSLLMALQAYCDETVQERRQKDQKAFREQKLEEW